jgi:hypothetical protein
MTHYFKYPKMQLKFSKFNIHYTVKPQCYNLKELTHNKHKTESIKSKFLNIKKNVVWQISQPPYSETCSCGAQLNRYINIPSHKYICSIYILSKYTCNSLSIHHTINNLSSVLVCALTCIIIPTSSLIVLFVFLYYPVLGQK